MGKFRIILILALLLKGYDLSAQSCSAYAGKDSTICSSNNGVYLNGVVKKASTGEWSGGTGTFSPDNVTLSTTYIPSPAEITAGYVNLILKTTNGGCTGGSTKRDTVKITITRAPSPTITGPSSICEYSTGNAYSVPAVTGNTYSWYVVGGTIQSGQGTSSINVGWGSAGPGYIYMIQGTASGCSGVGSINTVSRFDFNSSNLLKATLGPDASSVDADAVTTGKGLLIAANCNGDKGLDLNIPGSVFDRGKMCMTFSWQRDEGDARFFVRGGTEFSLSGGALRIKFRVDSAGQTRNIGPITTGYTIPNDDVFRFFTFCYDSASGVAKVLVNDSTVWSYTSTSNVSLQWTSAGNAVIGEIMDGNCSGNALLDWANISIPISIISKPRTTLTGPATLCQLASGTYQCSAATYSRYNWSVSGGTITSGQGSTQIQVRWTSSGSQSVTLTLTDTLHSCDSLYTYNVSVNPLPPANITGKDSSCVNAVWGYKTNKLAGYSYSWQSSSGTFQTLTTLDTIAIKWTSAGTHSLYVQTTITATGCSLKDTQKVVVKAYPSAAFSAPASVCIGDQTMHTVSPAAGMTYSWLPAGAVLSAGQGNDTCSVLWNVSGNKSLKLVVQDASFGCTTENTKAVFVRPKPVTGTIRHD